ncbi:MAG: glycosyltransferase family 2 protein [Oligoflexia bacterium]|nr:glycosyltransferase family 2 protein [Oligoflexia bacterium]
MFTIKLFFQSVRRKQLRSFLKMIYSTIVESVITFWEQVFWGRYHLGDITRLEWLGDLEKRLQTTRMIFSEKYGSEINFSILMPVYQPDPVFFKKALKSACSQCYDNFEVILGLDGPQPPGVMSVIEDLKAGFTDNKEFLRVVKIDREGSGGGISNTTNIIADEAANNYIVLMDHDDWIRPDLLLRYAETLLAVEDRTNTVLYCNEFKIDARGEEKLNSFLWKPDVPPFPYVFVNYICHCLMVPKKLFLKVGKLRSECDGAQDYDLVLRLNAAKAVFQNCPFFLYAWRAHGQSTASCINTKDYASSAGIRALTDYAASMNLKWTAEDESASTVYRIKPSIDVVPGIQVIIPFKDNKDLTLKCVKTVLAQQNVKTVITAVDNNSTDKSIAAELEQLGTEVLFIPEPYNYSRFNNMAARQGKKAAGCELVLFLNNDVELEKDALYEMACWVYQPRIGIVGCSLFYPGGGIYQHSGIGNIGDSISPYFSLVRNNRHTGLTMHLKGFENVIRPVDAVTTACAMMKREVFESVGGFDEVFYPIAYSDVDLCRRLKQKGLYSLYTPYAGGIHHEGASRGTFAIEDYELSDWLRKKLGR